MVVVIIEDREEDPSHIIRENLSLWADMNDIVEDTSFIEVCCVGNTLLWVLFEIPLTYFGSCHVCNTTFWNDDWFNWSCNIYEIFYRVIACVFSLDTYFFLNFHWTFLISQLWIQIYQNYSVVESFHQFAW